MRLDKLLANMGFGTRKTVKTLLKAKEVTVNGRVIKDGKSQVDPDKDKVVVAGEAVEYQEFVYFMLHKPQGVVSATNDNLHKTVIDLLAPKDQVLDPFPVGRLDKDTEGLLLLTNDGTLAHNLLSPKKHVDKCYKATINGIVNEQDIVAFKNGITLNDGFNCQSAELDILSIDVDAEQSIIQVTIHEGKFHQVKRMFEAVDKSVTYLKRLSMGNLKLDETLEIGKYRQLTEEELSSLTNE
ncbi:MULTISPECIES: pseudouridine synthase [Carnobacterium]|uniref:Pseudouridine synthase n=2 Tax=Carnobacterium inhibens TaxID=147709 RepID=U5S7J2_9LACT|nr:pseudouridine synthase [Carnobacterium inhibens]AGY81160.1 RNA pseudouridine synthase [Carnobacterium inhibens subsp. gilichinskyi]MBC9826118.1 pseudouridine synthase [Carnobacterium inhibens]MCM3513524.1 rRNA pseudouridine synthase [Carnobacterium inhibens]